MRKVLIAGVNGFLGNALRRHLAHKASSLEVHGVDRKKVFPSRRFAACDLGKSDQVAKLLLRLKPDYIFHLAGGRIDREKDLLKENLQTTRILLDAVSSMGGYKPRIVIPGSAAEYGRAAAALKETMLPKPVTFYGVIKNTQTNLGLMYAHRGLDVVIARIFNVCGRGTPEHLSLGRFAKQISLIGRKRMPPVVRAGYLGAKRDFLDVEDVCSALWALARKGKRGEVYNVCSGRAYVMRALLEKMIACAKGDRMVVKEDRHKGAGIDVSLGSNAKIKRATGWRPTTGMAQSLQETLASYL